jgi:hypothetical protein
MIAAAPKAGGAAHWLADCGARSARQAQGLAGMADLGRGLSQLMLDSGWCKVHHDRAGICQGQGGRR